MSWTSRPDRANDAIRSLDWSDAACVAHSVVHRKMGRARRFSLRGASIGVKQIKLSP
jgi:hypothetical protein